MRKLRLIPLFTSTIMPFAASSTWRMRYASRAISKLKGLMGSFVDILQRTLRYSRVRLLCEYHSLRVCESVVTLLSILSQLYVRGVP